MVLSYTKNYRFLAKKSDSWVQLASKEREREGENKQRYLGYIIHYVLNLHGQYVRIILIKMLYYRCTLYRRFCSEI